MRKILLPGCIMVFMAASLHPLSAAAEPAPADLNIRIVGTASFQGKHTALIEDLNTRSDSFYKVGDPIYGYQITGIAADGIRLEKDGKKSFVAFETISLKVRSEEAKAETRQTVVANVYIPQPMASSGSSLPNFYTDAPKTTTRWDLFTPGMKTAKSAKTPSMAGVGAMASLAGKFLLPVSNFKRMSSAFGYRRHPIGGGSKMHKGIDLSANRGTRILAADGGVITFSGWKGGYGYCVMIDHQNGYESLYGHCSKLIADVGDNVSRGDLIAEVGSTGASTGNHLHFEVHKDKVPVDPESFFPAL